MNNKERIARIAAVTSIIGLAATASSCDWNVKHEEIIPPGKTISVQPNQYVIGDVGLLTDGYEIDLFDTDKKTGLIVDVRVPSDIIFPDGGKIGQANIEDKDKAIEKTKNTMIKTEHLDKVDVIVVDGRGKQDVQGQAQIDINNLVKMKDEENLPSREIQKGQIVDVMPNEFISGDVLLINKDGSKTKLCDSKDETALIVDIKIPSKIEFAFGAGSIQPVVNLQNKAQMIENTRLRILKAGREQVDVITVDGIGVQKVQGQETSTTEEQINGPRVFSKGETAILGVNDIISADPSAVLDDGSILQLCDSDGDTALIIINRKKDAKFIFDNGGSVLSLSDLSKTEEEIEKIKMQKIAEGFKRVDVIEFTGKPGQETQ